MAQAFPTDRSDAVKLSGIMDNQISQGLGMGMSNGFGLSMKRGLLDLSSDLVSAIGVAGRESKSQLSKASERMRVL